MTIRVELGKFFHGEVSLSEALDLEDRVFLLEAVNAREVVEQLRVMNPKTEEAFKIWFNSLGCLRSSWWVTVNKDSLNAKGISSEVELDEPLNEGDCIYITSCV